MTKGAKKFRSAMCVILSFLMAVTLTLAGMLLVVDLTGLNASYAIRVAEKSGFAEKLQSELKEEFISYGNACNVDESFFDGVFTDIITVEQLNSDFAAVLRGFYSNQNDEIDTQLIENKLLTALEQYAEEKGFASSEALTQSLTEMCVEMGDLYTAYVAVFQASYFSTAANMLTRAKPMVRYATLGLLLFHIASMIIIRLSFKKRKNWLRYFGYAYVSSTLMLMTAPLTALVMKIGGKINIANASLYGFASDFINGIFISMLIVAGITAVIAVMNLFFWKTAVNKNE